MHIRAPEITLLCPPQWTFLILGSIAYGGSQGFAGVVETRGSLRAVYRESGSPNALAVLALLSVSLPTCTSITPPHLLYAPNLLPLILTPTTLFHTSCPTPVLSPSFQFPEFTPHTRDYPPHTSTSAPIPVGMTNRAIDICVRLLVAPLRGVVQPE